MQVCLHLSCVYPSRQRYDRRALPYHKTDQPEPANCLAQPLSAIDVIDVVSYQQLDALATDLRAKILLRFAGFLMQCDLVFRSAVFLAMMQLRLWILHHCEILAGIKSGGNASA